MQAQPKTIRDILHTGDQYIIPLRALHVEMDQAVALAYGWPLLVNNRVVEPPSASQPSTIDHQPFDLGHGFHQTKQGMRYTISESARRTVLDRLLALNHQRYEEEVKAGLHEKKRRAASGERRAEHQSHATMPAAGVRQTELTLDIPATPAPSPPAATPDEGRAASGEAGPSRQEIGHRELLNAIFTCAARRAVTEREQFVLAVAHELGFQRLGSRIQEMIASGINSAIRRGLIAYEGRDIHRLASTYADLDIEALVAAVNATIKPGCVYTPEQAMVLAADYLGNKRMTDTFQERLQSALTAASRRGLIIRRGEEVRKLA